MSLYNGIDTTAVISGGTYTETYGSTSPGSIANLCASYGLIEDAPEYIATIIAYIATSLGLNLSFII